MNPHHIEGSSIVGSFSLLCYEDNSHSAYSGRGMAFGIWRILIIIQRATKVDWKHTAPQRRSTSSQFCAPYGMNSNWNKPTAYWMSVHRRSGPGLAVTMMMAAAITGKERRCNSSYPTFALTSHVPSSSSSIRASSDVRWTLIPLSPTTCVLRRSRMGFPG